MGNRPRHFWRALETVPGLSAVDAEWRMRCGAEYASVKSFLRPNGKRASSHPCTARPGCGCAHEVVEHGPDDIVAVCWCGRGCQTFPLKGSDIVVYELDRTAIDLALASAFNLREDPDSETGLYQTTRIGVYAPYSGFRFPVYLTIQVEPGDFDHVVDSLLCRTDGPLILLAPTRDLYTTRSERLLTGRKSAFVPLSEEVVIGEGGMIRLLRPLDEVMSMFRKANLPCPKADNSMVFFPTPPEATWRDVAIRFVDGHTISVQAKAERRVCNYTQMSMANRKNGEPTIQWALLRAIAEERGVLDWDSHQAHRRNQKRREILARNLRNFFHIEDDPFCLTEDGKGWRARFLISPDD